MLKDRGLKKVKLGIEGMSVMIKFPVVVCFCKICSLTLTDKIEKGNRLRETIRVGEMGGELRETRPRFTGHVVQRVRVGQRARVDQKKRNRPKRR